MDMHALDAKQGSDSYLFGPRQAWFAFAMTLVAQGIKALPHGLQQ